MANVVLTAEMMRKAMREARDNYQKNTLQQPIPPIVYPSQAKHEPWKTMLATGRAFLMTPLSPTGPSMGRTPTMIITDEASTLDPDAYEAPDKPQPQGKAFTMSQTGVIHPPPAEFTAEEVQQDPILRYFHYAHLPPVLREVSAPFAAQARFIIDKVPRNAERSAGLRKLLEAKDCIVRSMI